MESKNKKKTIKLGGYDEGIGRRKTSNARVRLFVADKKGEKGEPQIKITINDKPLEKYLFLPKHQLLVLEAIKLSGLGGAIEATVKVVGGGIASQAEAIRHGLSRALIKFNPELRKVLKTAGFLKRDPRMVERKKYGLKKARKAPQWSKR